MTDIGRHGSLPVVDLGRASLSAGSESSASLSQSELARIVHEAAAAPMVGAAELSE